MKRLIKAGLFLGLGWLAQSADAQEIQWRAAPAKNTEPHPILPANVNPGLGAATNVRTVSVGQPTRLDPSAEPAVGSFRPINTSGVVVRGQAPDEKTVPLPSLVIGGEPKAAKPLPKDKGFPPPPAPVTATPSPVFDTLGITEDNCCTDTCVRGLRHKVWGGGWGRGWGNCCNDGCCPDRGRGWVNAELLLWWQRAQDVPALVTAGPVGGTGRLDDPATTVLYDTVPNNLRAGGRFSAGMWFPHGCNLGGEITYFFLGRQTNSATYGATADTQIFRPFFDSELRTNDAEFANTVNVQTYSQLWGIEANLRKQWHCGPNYWIDLIGGYRHLNLSEGISITETRNVPLAQTGGIPVTSIESESFGTRNQFNGAQLGIVGESRVWNRCFVGFTAKLAMGVSHQIINIDGNTTFITPGGSIAQRGALLAGPTNSGQYTANRFAVLPEVGLKFGIDVTEHLRVYAGYDFLYLSSVLRPGDQIDLNVNPSYRPTIFGPGAGLGERKPIVPYRTSDFWAQGLNFGLQYRY